MTCYHDSLVTYVITVDIIVSDADIVILSRKRNDCTSLIVVKTENMKTMELQLVPFDSIRNNTYFVFFLLFLL